MVCHGNRLVNLSSCQNKKDLGQHLLHHQFVEAKTKSNSFQFHLFSGKTNSFVCYVLISIGRNKTPPDYMLWSKAISHHLDSLWELSTPSFALNKQLHIAFLDSYEHTHRTQVVIIKGS